ncbi:MAG TPA: cation-translocating P-type ATPase [candidate division Zixibacteria bacterium]|nr:cation-translocating P-type ATPase [candidate division Zixibacteria bacterium]HER00304.1 cation-translocating P-type ATPase [candidate division Zixibacteria bacterium]
MNREIELKIVDLDCPDCAASLEKGISRLKGVKNCSLEFATGKINLSIDNQIIDREKVIKEISRLGHVAVDKSAGGHEVSETKGRGSLARLKDILLMVAVTAMLIEIALSVFDQPGYLQIIFSVTAILTGGLFIFRSAFYALKNLTADMNLLMSLAVIGAVIIGEWSEAAVTIVLFSIANYLEGRSVRKAHRAFKSLTEQIPHEIEMETADGPQRVRLEDLKQGDIILLKPGMTCPTDCEIAEGTAYINQAAVTGESMPVSKTEGDKLLGGSINTDGFLKARVLKPFSDSTLTRIMHMVEEAASRKSRLASIVDRFAKVYTPIVVGIAILVFAIPVLFFHGAFETWFYRALVFLVISCPCALVISTPVAVICGLTRSARGGILIKGGVFLEKLANVRAVLFDKTGTLTEGRFGVVHVVSLDGHSSDNIIALAASVEQFSEHPIAGAILEHARSMKIKPFESRDFRAFPGEGARAQIEGSQYTIGSHRFFHDSDITDVELHKKVTDFEDKGYSLVLLARDDRLIGAIALADMAKSESAEAIAELYQSGISESVMLTGDNARTAESIAEQLGIRHVESQLLPEEKSKLVQKYREKYGLVAMVGDGINDAPALALADVGIAMGTGGSDLAIEAADVAIIGDNPKMVPKSIKLSRRTLGIIKFNIVFSLLVKFIFMILAGLGLATLWMAVFADMGTSLLVIANSLRLLQK